MDLGPLDGGSGSGRGSRGAMNRLFAMVFVVFWLGCAACFTRLIDDELDSKCPEAPDGGADSGCAVDGG